MALPHYKLHTSDQSLDLQPSAFPVILVPADPPRKAERLRQILRSRKLLTTLGIVSVLASAALLWLWLDPNNKVVNPRQLMIPAAVLAICLLFFLLAALVGRGTEEQVPILVEDLVMRTDRMEIFTPKAPSKQIRVYCEQWSSQPFMEIIDESLLAEVFNDEMLAPDHMVFSLKIDE